MDARRQIDLLSADICKRRQRSRQDKQVIADLRAGHRDQQQQLQDLQAQYDRGAAQLREAHDRAVAELKAQHAGALDDKGQQLARLQQQIAEYQSILRQKDQERLQLKASLEKDLFEQQDVNSKLNAKISELGGQLQLYAQNSENQSQHVEKLKQHYEQEA